MLKKLVLAFSLIAIFAVSAVIIPFDAVRADIIFTDGFENGDFSGWTTVGSPSIVNSPVKDGSYAAMFPLVTPACYGAKFIEPTSTLNYTYYVYFNAFCSDYICIVLAMDANGTLIHYRVQNDYGTYRWQFNVGTSLVINASTPTPQAGQWYKIQMLAMTGSNSTFYFLVNDQLRATITNQTFGDINQVRIGHDWDEGWVGGGDVLFDNIEVTNITTPVIIASAGEGGTITPSGAISVEQGSDQTFAIAANQGYHISDVTVNGTSVGAVASYTFTNVQGNYVILATFEANPTPSPTPTPTSSTTHSQSTSSSNSHTTQSSPSSSPDPTAEPTATPTEGPNASPSITSQPSTGGAEVPWLIIGVAVALLAILLGVGLTIRHRR